MKKTIIVFLTALTLAIIGCDMGNGNPTDPNNPGGGTGGDETYVQELWGEWVRMDTGDRWYIASDALKINGATASKSASLAKQSDRVIKVTEGTRNYYLYAARTATASFTGVIVGGGSAVGSARAVGGGLGGIGVAVANLSNKANELTTTTDDAGVFTARGVVPGDSYLVTPQVEGGKPVTVTPSGDGDDIGVVTITSGVNFKTGIAPAQDSMDMNELYINETYAFTLTFENVGDAICRAPSYVITAPDGVTITGDMQGILGSLAPGAKKSVPIAVRCSALTNDYEYKNIRITITEVTDEGPKTWEDAVSLRFYREALDFNIRAERATSGIIISPDQKTYSFTNTTAATVSAPLRRTGDYLVVFSGADISTESRYALGVGVEADADFGSLADASVFEPNNTETAAVPLDAAKVTAYLDAADIDYYRVSYASLHIPAKPAGVSAIANAENGRVSISWDAVPGAASYNIYRSTGERGGYVKVGAASTAVYVDDTVRTAGTYYYKASAVDAGGTEGFYSVPAAITVTGMAVDAVGLAESLAWISANAEEGGIYNITVSADESLAPTALSYEGKNVGITLIGEDAERVVSLSSAGSLFTVESGVTLTLGSNVTLRGISGNHYPLVLVNSGGTLVMNDGSTITGNTNTYYYSSSSSYDGTGGGVYVNGGTFEMSGGEISGNTASGPSSSNGGGVYVSSGTFTQSGGEISGNTASSGSGSGVYVDGGTFTQSGGEISGNTASYYGGGVYVASGTFTQSGGTISGNTGYSGGGVYVDSNGTFEMTSGEISGNTAAGSSNASGYGGGVYVGREYVNGTYFSGTFTKSGGVIYGVDASGALKNTASGMNYGHAVYVDGSPVKRRNTTVGEDEALDSAKSGAAGGWVESLLGGLSLADSLAWISANAGEGEAYTVTVNADETLAPQSLSYEGKNVSIRIDGEDAERVVSLSLFTVGSGVTLTLGENLTLRGLVRVNSGGTFTMNDGSKITGNTVSSSSSSSYPSSSSSSGGGVYVDGGTFTMTGGAISGNTVSSSSSLSSASYGGGVYVAGGTFTMTGGEISGNTVSSSSSLSSAYGGGVYVDSGTFTMIGGAISGNTVSASYSASGGGVYVAGGTFTKSGGVIYGVDASGALKNTASGVNNGHAVYASGKRRNATVGEDEALDSAKSGAAGGWLESSLPGGLSLAESLAWISINATEGGNYSVTVNADATLAPRTLSYSGKNVGVTLIGEGAERVVSLSGNGSLFTVESGVTLTLGENLTLRGLTSYNYYPLVRVNSGGTLVMNGGSTITGNTNSYNSSYGGGSGGGVYVDGGTFTMEGGEVSGNTATGSSSSVYGGGVYVYSGTFTMSGGEISGNTAAATASGYGSYGGGVYVASSGTFTMESGEISGNTASSGGGVYVNGGTFTKQAGVIYGMDASGALKNTVRGIDYGHAVYVDGSPVKRRNSTVGEDESLDSAKDGAAGGWVESLPGGLSLADSLAWISLNVAEGGAYSVTLSADESLAPQTLSYSGKNVSIRIDGGTAERTVSLGSTGSLFTVESGVTLTLGANVTLRGIANNSAALVRVNSGGTLVMEDDAKISGNSTDDSTSSYGGGVYVNGGTFTLSGGEISGNTSYYDGGGVYVNGGTFTLSGGEISGNTSYYGGGGVYVGSSGTFTQSGGEISGNTASYYGGGGVYVGGGSFVKQAGVIYGADASASLRNIATTGAAYGHAVYVSSGGKIRNATADASVTLDSGLGGASGGWADGWTDVCIGIDSIVYSYVSGGTWTLLEDGRRQSPAISHGDLTKSRVSFTTASANAFITVQLDVSSASSDYAFISQLDNASATYDSGYYRRTSGETSVTVTILVPTAGNHFIDIGYKKDSSGSSGSDCVWFKVLE